MKNLLQLFISLLSIVLFSFSSLAQTTVSGTITDAESGETLIGANVLIEGTTEGTVTDIDGKYTLTSKQPLPWTLNIS